MKFSEQMLLITKGYSKKEIQELKDMEAEELKAAMTDEEEAPDQADTTPDQSTTEPEPDYKKLYEELLAKNEQTEKDLKDIRDKNIRSNAAPAAEDIKKEQEDTLISIARSFM